MKRKNRNQKNAISNVRTAWLSGMRGTRKGLGLMLSAMLLAGSVHTAQAAEIIKSYDYQSSGASLEGYVISPVDLGNGNEGTASAGNYDAGSGIHFQVVDNMGSVMSSTVYKFPAEQDVRVVSIATYEAQRFLVTIQARQGGESAHVLTLMLDMNGNIMEQYYLYVPSDFGKHIFPMHSTIIQNQLYICGYVSNAGDFPNDPRYTDDRTSFVGKIDLNTHLTDVHYYYSAQNMTTVGGSWNGLYNDYDAAMRLKGFDTRLFVMGSANGSVNLTGTSTSINASKAWISEIDPLTLYPISTSYFGNAAAPAATTPSTLNGTYALDIVGDGQATGFYALTNDLAGNTWKVSHLAPSLTISTPATGSNSVTYNGAGALIKGSGLATWNSSPNRFSLYGMVGNDIALDNNGAYGSTIGSPTAGGIPFIMGMDLTYSNSGIVIGGPKGNVLGNQLTYESGLDYQQPFWTPTTMGEWCNPAFGVKMEPGGNDEMVLMGHFFNPASSRVNPRYISATAEGYVNGCPSAEPMVFGTGVTNLTNATVTAQDLTGDSYFFDYPVDVASLNPDAEYDCEATNIYRTAKPGATAMAEVSEAKGIYPNPATDQVTIQLGRNAKPGAAVKVVLSDITGRVVLMQEGNANGTLLQLALPKLTAGMYQASVMVQDGKPEVYKLDIR